LKNKKKIEQRHPADVTFHPATDAGPLHILLKAGETMKIDIDKLSEAELIALNNRIVERLRFLNQKRAHEHMLKFQIGERVTFQPEGLPPVVGMLTRYDPGTWVTLYSRYIGDTLFQVHR
jgi:hypothetical protein